MTQFDRMEKRLDQMASSLRRIEDLLQKIANPLIVATCDPAGSLVNLYGDANAIVGYRALADNPLVEERIEEARQTPSDS